MHPHIDIAGNPLPDMVQIVSARPKTVESISDIPQMGYSHSPPHGYSHSPPHGYRHHAYPLRLISWDWDSHFL